MTKTKVTIYTYQIIEYNLHKIFPTIFLCSKRNGPNLYVYLYNIYATNGLIFIVVLFYSTNSISGHINKFLYTV